MMNLTTLAAIALAFSCAACGGSSAAGAADTFAYDNHSEQPARIGLGGIEIEIAPELKSQFSSITVAGSDSTQTVTQINLPLIPEDELTLDPGHRIWLGGKRLELDGDRLEIGGFGFGKVSAGDAVLIDKRGVHVNEQLRGHLPFEVR
jgi:hypothetical protein